MGQHGMCDPVCAELPAPVALLCLVWCMCGVPHGASVCMESGRTCEAVIVGRTPPVPCTLDSSTHFEMHILKCSYFYRHPFIASCVKSLSPPFPAPYTHTHTHT